MSEKPTKTQLIVDVIYGADQISMEEVVDETGLPTDEVERKVLKLKRERMLELKDGIIIPNDERIRQKYIKEEEIE